MCSEKKFVCISIYIVQRCDNKFHKGNFLLWVYRIRFSEMGQDQELDIEF